MEPDGVRVNESAVEWAEWRSPKGTFVELGREVSRWLTAAAKVPDEQAPARHRPFDVELVRVLPGKRPFPRHGHTVQWEYYIVLSGRGLMIQDDGADPIPMEPGDHLIQPPGWVHTIENTGTEDLLYYVIADNPADESCWYPDSQKWATAGHVFRMAEADYWDGEE